MSDRDDPIIDALLEEVLGGRTPPDLSARIMQSLAIRGAKLSVVPHPDPSPRLAEPVPPPPPALAVTAPTSAASNGHIQVAVGGKSPRARKSTRSSWQMVAAVALVVLVGIGLGGLGIIASRNKPAHPNLAKNSPKVGNSAGKHEKALVKKNTPAPKKQISKPPEESALAAKSPDKAPPSITIPPLEEPNFKPALSPGFPERDYAVKPSPDPEIFSFVSAELHRSWAENKVNPAPLAGDGEWCRRVFVRLLGRIPTAEETLSFLYDPGKDKRQKLVDKLLSDEEYVEQYAQYWAGVWANVLIGRTTGTQEGSLVHRAGFEQYLRRSLAQNKPYDKLVYELLTATGSTEPGTDDHNGAANFVLAGLNESATLVTARTARVFLGQQLQCAQCHQHPSQDWSQGHYWSLNAFFRQVQVQTGEGGPRVVDADFHALRGVTEEGEVYYQQPNGQMKAAFPQFLDGTTIPSSGLVSAVNRREELAKLIVRSDYLPKTLVNRLWSHFFGYGFTRPIDDMGPANTPSHPELLDRLSKEFVARGYDLKGAIRWIVLSDAFGRSSQIPVGSLADSPDAGTAPLFSHYYTRQMQAEEVYNSLLAAANLRSKSGENTKALVQARVDWLSQFNRPMGTDDGEEESQFNGSLRQSLEMMNGDLIRQTVSAGKDGFLQGLIRSEMPISEKVEHLFLAALSRKPTSRELSAIQKILSGAQEKPASALEDIWWALLNSNEFILDH